jgi:hypothetical protein
MKLIMMADGLFLYKTDTGYKVENPDGVTLTTGKTVRVCDYFISKELQARSTAERYASLNNIPTNIPST